MTTYNKPLPTPTTLSKPFWDGARAGLLRVQRCERCAHTQHPPRPSCSNCWHDRLEWITCSGEGEIYTYTVCHWPTMGAFKRDAPYIVAIVELPEGVRLNAGIIDCPIDRVAIGMKVKVAFTKATDEVTLVNFAPIPIAG